MLTGLSINNVVLIDRLHLEPQPGFTSLTGETGAGKSILLDALSLAMGHKADSDIIRMNTDQATVIASFDIHKHPPSHSLIQLLQDNAIEHDGEILLKRVISRAHKSKAFINDQPVSLNLLKQIGDYVLHVHGQHDHLLNEQSHKTLLHNFARIHDTTYDAAFLRTEQAYHAWHDAHVTYTDFIQKIEEFKEQRAYYSDVCADLGPLKLSAGDETRLIEQRQSVQHIGKVIKTVEQVMKGLDTPQSYVNTLYGFQKSLERCLDDHIPALQHARDALERASIEITEAQTELRSVYDADQTSADELERIDEQLHIMRNFARKYRTTTDGLCELLATAERAVNHEDDLLLERQSYERALNDAREHYHICAQQLYDRTKDAAHTLSALVMAELPELKLDRAQFEVRVTHQSDTPTRDGGCVIAFWVSMNAGQQSAPLAKTASGGEMARLMLVLKMVIAQTTAMPTLIFDEIDTGVGGAVATAIGAKLRRLSDYVQVLAITHSAQVAAMAHHQWRIYKTTQNDLTSTHVMTLTDDARVDEIARMLSGSTLTDEARSAARMLL